MIGIDHIPRWSGVDNVTMVGAHPNDGAMALGQIDSSDIVAVPISRMNTSQPLKQTQKLTVWRTLNVECDAMEYYPGTTNTGTVITPPNPSLYLGDFVASELARACVITNVYSPNTHQPNRGHNPMTAGEMLGLLGLEIVNTGEGPMLENDPNATPTTTGLDCYGNTSAFWVVRIVMASSTPAAVFGGFTSGTHTIDISYEYIKSRMSESYQSYTESQLENAIRQTILHEISHVLINENDTNAGIRKSPITLEEKLQTAYQ